MLLLVSCKEMKKIHWFWGGPGATHILQKARGSSLTKHLNEREPMTEFRMCFDVLQSHTYLALAFPIHKEWISFQKQAVKITRSCSVILLNKRQVRFVFLWKAETCG